MQQLAIIILLAGWLGYQNLALAEPQKIILATDEWEPYISKTKAGHVKFSEMVSAVFKEIGMETEFVFAPWKRVEAIVKGGEVFAGIPYSYTVKRNKTFDYSIPIMNSLYVFFYNKKAHPEGIK
jgi:polar amino acid transport system substrate-binding protein